LLLAIAAGVMLAGPPVVGFNLWLNDLVERQAEAELEHSASRSMALAEGRISFRTISRSSTSGPAGCAAPRC